MKGKKHKLVCTLVRDEGDGNALYNIVPRGLEKELDSSGDASNYLVALCRSEFESIFPGLKLEPGEAVDITITITEDE